MEMAAPVRRANAYARTSSGLGLVMAVAAALAICLALAVAVDPRIAYLAAVAIVGPIAIYFMVSRPSIAVAAALASHAWSIELAGQFVTPFKITGVLAILIVGRKLIASGRVHPFPRAYSYGLGALLTLVALGELFAEYEGSVAPFFEFGGTLIIFALMTQTMLGVADFRTLARVYTVNLLFTFASVALEVGWAALSESGTRAGGICGQPNGLGNHLAMSLPFALALIADRYETVMWRAVAFIAVLGSVYGEWAAASRGGTIGFVAALFAFAFLAPRRNGIRVTALVLAVVAAGAFSAFAPKSFNRVTDTFDGTIDIDTATSERTLHARIGAEMFPKHPYLGAGVTAFGYERSRYSGALGGALHSSVLAVAVSYGLPALVLYVLLQLTSVVAAIRSLSDDPSRVFIAALAAGAIAAITSSLSGTELFRAEQWGIVSLCQIAALRARINREGPASA